MRWPWRVGMPRCKGTGGMGGRHCEGRSGSMNNGRHSGQAVTPTAAGGRVEGGLNNNNNIVRVVRRSLDVFRWFLHETRNTATGPSAHRKQLSPCHERGKRTPRRWPTISLRNNLVPNGERARQLPFYATSRSIALCPSTYKLLRTLRSVYTQLPAVVHYSYNIINFLRWTLLNVSIFFFLFI